MELARVSPDVVSQGVVIRIEAPFVHLFERTLNAPFMLSEAVYGAHFACAIQAVKAEDEERASRFIRHDRDELFGLLVGWRVPYAHRQPVIPDPHPLGCKAYFVRVIVYRAE